ncbi:MAG: hypothetical protein AAGM67_12520 [Bacteroidota bacterium]
MAEDSNDVASLEARTCRRKGAGRKAIFTEQMQEELLQMIQRLRDQGVAVACQDIQSWARVIAKSHSLENFTASNGWLYRFTHRHDLTVRRRTGDGYALPFDYQEQIREMTCKIDELRLQHEIPDDLVLNADETGVFLDAVTTRTIDFKGEKAIRVRSSGKEKSRVTFMVTATLSGELLKPFVILKGTRISRLRKFHPSARVLSDAVLSCSSNVWMTTLLMQSWLTRVVIPYTNGRKAILLMDNFGPHKANDVIQLMEENNILPVWVPKNSTSVGQPCDIRINANLKSSLRKSWRLFVQNQFLR